MDFQENILSNAFGFLHELLEEFREYSRMNLGSEMKSKILHIFVAKFSDEKMQFCPRNYRRNKLENSRKFLLGDTVTNSDTLLYLLDKSKLLYIIEDLLIWD